jgi:RNase adapter protein RapZ
MEISTSSSADPESNEPRSGRSGKTPKSASRPGGGELVIITGLSGSGKGTVLRALEDFGYYSVDNLPIELIPQFAELTRESSNIKSAALVVDIREGEALRRFPAMYRKLRKGYRSRLVFLEAEDASLVRRFSETRRPHPLGREDSVPTSIRRERSELREIRGLADLIIDTSKFNVHELREQVREYFQAGSREGKILISVISFGYKNGIPHDTDLLFDVRFLPNPNYVPEYRELTGKQKEVAKYIRGFPQTGEFIDRVSELLVYLLPHYISEGKSYLTIGFGCTGGQHRSVMIAAEVRKRLASAGYKVKEQHRDIPR